MCMHICIHMCTRVCVWACAHTLRLEEKLGRKASKDNKRNCRRARIPVRLFLQEVLRPESPARDRRMISIPKGLFITCSDISNKFGACDGPGSYFFFKSLYLVSLCVGPRMNEWSKWWLQAKKKVNSSKKKKNLEKQWFPWLLEIILCVSHHVIYCWVT